MKDDRKSPWTTAWVGTLATAVLTGIGAWHGSAVPETPAQPPKPRIRAHAAPQDQERPERERSSPADRLDRSGDSASPAAPERPTPAPSPAVEKDGDLLQAWLSGLSDADLERVIGTPQLDRWVGRVIETGFARRTDFSGPGETDRFLNALNARIRAIVDRD